MLAKLTPTLLGQCLYALVVPPVWTDLDVLSPTRSIIQWNSDQLPRYIALARNRLHRHMAKASQWFFPRRNSALENLPTEILVDILEYVGWRDILACRQTCKRLSEISTARRFG
ncbi:hypothetical protein BJ912DRAFT_244005 [Pholiota molesta]|nr:hypothetical protein BJ912DRAFT_244005 [Pholiota molesta]